MPDFGLDVTDRAKAILKKDIVARGSETFVAGLLLLLLVLVVMVLRECLFQLYRGREVPRASAWKSLLMFTHTVSSPKSFEEVRRVSLVSVLSKWYMGCLTILYDIDCARR